MSPLNITRNASTKKGINNRKSEGYSLETCSLSHDENRERRIFVFIEAKKIVILVAIVTGMGTHLTYPHLREFLPTGLTKIDQICMLNTLKMNDVLEFWTFASLRE